LFGAFFSSVLLNPCIYIQFQKLGKVGVNGFDSEVEIGIGFASKTEARMSF
jgi:hypothetical protein